MPQMDPHVQIARKIRSIETAKTELIQQMAEVFRTVQSGNERDMTKAIGGLIGIAYAMGTQIGLDLDAIDREIVKAVPHWLTAGLVDVEGLERVQRHVDVKR